MLFAPFLQCSDYLKEVSRNEKNGKLPVKLPEQIMVLKGYFCPLNTLGDPGKRHTKIRARYGARAHHHRSAL